MKEECAEQFSGIMRDSCRKLIDHFKALHKQQRWLPVSFLHTSGKSACPQWAPFAHDCCSVALQHLFEGLSYHDFTWKSDGCVAWLLLCMCPCLCLCVCLCGCAHHKNNSTSFATSTLYWRSNEQKYDTECGSELL
eukprot:3257702-Amphidinium_carterae.1